VWGIVLIAAGLTILVLQLVPGVWSWLDLTHWWPLIVVGLGVLFFVLAVVARSPAMVVPACTISGIGLLLAWQTWTSNWGTWAWAWALIPGFVGVGVLLRGLLEGRPGSAVTEGGVLLVISLFLLIVFGSLLGGPSLLGNYWPVLVILLGVVFLARALLGTRST
jgi:hypothetical protein